MKFKKERVIAEIATFYERNLRVVMSQTAKNGLNILLSFVETDERWKDVNQLAYFLATIGHETAWTFQPIKEHRASTNSKVRKLQDRYWHSGYYGRGYVQITWDYNYQKFANILRVDLISKPDLALEYNIAYSIASTGMMQGIFTGKKLSDYIKNGRVDFLNSRRIINGTDKADTIASYASVFVRILKQNSIETVIKMTEHPVTNKDTNELLKNNSPAASTTTGDNKDEPAMPIFKHQPETVKSFKQTITGIVASLGISASTVLGKAYNFFSDPKVYWVAFAIVLVIFISLLVNYFINKVLNDREKERAHQLTLEELKIRANPNLQNVAVDRDIYF